MASVPDHLRLAALHGEPDTEDDVLRDYAAELAVLHGLAVDEAWDRLERFLSIYHYGSEPGTAEEWAAIRRGDDVEYSLLRITKPFRFRKSTTIPSTLKAIDAHLATGHTPPTLLDFGGGGGSDVIIYARSGLQVSYADLTTLRHTAVVRRRFEIRNLAISVHDGLDLPNGRFDVVTAMDVLEHLYDVEEATASLLARIPTGGLLCCANAFSQITFDGDHLDKNRVYVDIFPRLMDAAGFERVFDEPPLEVYRRTSAPEGDVDVDLVHFRKLLYQTTRLRAIERCAELLTRLDGVHDVAWSSLPDTVAHGAGAPSNPTAVKAAAYRLATRRAPPWVRRLGRRLRRQQAERAVVRGGNPVEDLSSLADWTSALRIAEHRIAHERPASTVRDR